MKWRCVIFGHKPQFPISFRDTEIVTACRRCHSPLMWERYAMRCGWQIRTLAKGAK